MKPTMRHQWFMRLFALYIEENDLDAFREPFAGMERRYAKAGRPCLGPTRRPSIDSLCMSRQVSPISPIDRTWHPGRAVFEHLIDDVFGNLLSLSPVRVSGPYHRIIAGANKFDGGLDLIAEMDT